MGPAAVMTVRFARLLVLACTLLGVAALHTLGHAGTPGLDHHGRAAVVAAPSVLAVVPVVTPGEDGDCDGDGCTHQAAMPSGTEDSSRWWEACVAVLTMLAAVVLGIRQAGTGDATGSAPGRPRRRPSATARPFGLAVTATAVLRT